MPDDRTKLASALEDAREDIRKIADKAVIGVRNGKKREQYRAEARERIERYKAALAKAPQVLNWSPDQVAKHKSLLLENLVSDMIGRDEPMQQVYRAAMNKLQERDLPFGTKP